MKYQQLFGGNISSPRFLKVFLSLTLKFHANRFLI